MSIIDNLLKPVRIPRMIRAKQLFAGETLTDIAAAVANEFAKPAIQAKILPGMTIAVAVGSRGIAALPEIVKQVVSQLQACGAQPFIVPAMGSHGGATAEGQIDVLASLGVTQSSAGCPIKSSMAVVKLGELDNGLPVLMDKNAMSADGIVVINRIKAHTGFTGPIESGVVKMITIGLGKQEGADACHTYGFGTMAANIVEMAKVKLARSNILFGVGILENAYDRTANIVAIPAETLLETEQRLLTESKKNLPQIKFAKVDILLVDQMGKDFSGSGMDCNVTGRAATPFVQPASPLNPSRLVVFDLSDKSHGNANGMGFADISTRRLFNKIDFDITYPNFLTSTVIQSGKIPVIMNSDKLAIQTAIKTCNIGDINQINIVRIANTMSVENIYISENMLAEAEAHPDIRVIGQAGEMAFDEDDNFTDLGQWVS
ncbi:lactate racemase domain-containing protein [Sodalis sp. RH21]|uniref:lactate racemase domain-containing protein n=1 Tax=unclassified Sodalis (in: enterobacteria) TaxID=2636512 RepID=UPI0039B3866F